MEATRTVTTPTKWVTVLTALSDLAIVICLIVWCGVASDRYNYWVGECADRYEYYVDGDTDPCVQREPCGDDPNCRLYEKFLSGLSSVDSDNCYSDDCGGGDCQCVVAGPWEGLFVSYSIFFAISMLMEVFKMLSVISAALSERCDPALYGPIETSVLQHCLDSWTLLFLRLIYPKRYEQLIKANEEGKIPVATRFKAGQWAYRDFACGLTLTLYPFKVGYFNVTFVPYVIFTIIYMSCLWYRSQWVQSKQPTAMVQQPPAVVTMMELQQTTTKPY